MTQKSTDAVAMRAAWSQDADVLASDATSGPRGGNAIDLTTLSVVGGYLAAAAEEMHMTLIRTAYSLNVKERADCSSSILDEDGRTVSLAADIPLHLGSMLGLVENVRAAFGDDLQPGDVFVANDPYMGGGTHLPDITLAAPIFAGTRLVAFSTNIAHHADVGGSSPGSVSVDHSDIFQEGLRLPVMRLVERGRLREDLVRLIQVNSRMPEDRLGDLRAQLAAIQVGTDRLRELLTRYGDEAVRAATRDLMAYSERRFRAVLATLPEGTVDAADTMDADEVVHHPTTIRVRVVCRAGNLHFDLGATDDQVASARNVPRNALLATIYTVVKQMLDPGIPANAGYYRTITVETRPGSIVDPLPPAAVGNRAVTCNIIGDAVARAISKLAPEQAIAGSAPHLNSIVAGIDPRSGEPFVNYEALAGAMGAGPGRDGLDAVRIYASGGANQSIEAMELAYSVEVLQYGFVTDSGGAGEYRGGLATRRDMRVFGRDLRFTGGGARIRIPPPGMAGGRDGRLAKFVLNPDTPTAEVLGGAISRRPLREGDVIRIETAGGGGFGDPVKRERERVRRDLREERVSAKAAGQTYRLADDQLT